MNVLKWIQLPVTVFLMIVMLPVCAQNYQEGSFEDCCIVCPQGDMDKACFQGPCMPARRSFSGGVGLAILLGAAAGAGTGYAAGRVNRCHSKSKKSCLEECFCSCKKVENSILIFNLEIIGGMIEGMGSPTDPIIVTAIVTTPGGCTIKGTSTEIFLEEGSAVLDFTGMVTLCDAQCGTYQFGLQIDSPVNLTSVDFGTANANAISNCPEMSTTAIVLPMNSMISEEFDHAQLLGPFVFAPDCCVISPNCQCGVGGR